MKALRHPVCTVDVAESIHRIWDDRRGYIPPPKPTEEVGQEDKGKRKDDHPTDTNTVTNTNDRSPSPSPTPPTPPRRPTKPALSVTELPRRLFRHLTAQSPVPPLLEYLFNTYPSISPNSHNGYPLSRAVLCQNKTVITYLLSRGADPGLRDGLAVEIAVKMGNFKLVRTLVDNPQGKTVDITSRFVELAVRSGSDEIVQYFVHDKGQSLTLHFVDLTLTVEQGVMPPLHSIMQMGSQPKTKTKTKTKTRKAEHVREPKDKDRSKKRKSSTILESKKKISPPTSKKPHKRSRTTANI